MRIRLASSGDAEAIRSIYNAEVLDSVNTFDMVPRTRDEQAAWLAEHQGVHPVIVATEPAEAEADGHRGANGELILGFGSLSAFRDRPGYAATAENSIYVDRLQRGKGVGRALLAELLELAAAHGFHSVIARVAGHNEVSVGLHQAAGFELVGVEREVGRKHRQWLDVVELQRLL
jgi:L-amino acid N-acyltransferase YncA